MSHHTIDVDPTAAIERAAALIEQADALVVAAGAGMGVDSGLPDFRGQEGFWRAYPALGRARIDFYSIASPSAFEAAPRLAWGARMLHGLSVFTSNVDGQFQQAGFDPQHLHECHGSLHYLQCLRPCCEAIWPADAFVPQVDEPNCRLLNAPPTCPHCGGLARPNVLMFSDDGWVEHRSAGQRRRQQAWLASVTRPVVVELGAGTAVPSVRHFSQRVLHQFGGRLVRINPREFEVPTRLDVGLPMGAAAGLAAIEQVLGWTR